jgi:CheY-like chemotaxis protein
MGVTVMSTLASNKYRILIVHDQKEVRDIVSKLLEYMGYEVVAASNGREGLSLFLNSQFNLVITDLSMPEVDGLTLAQLIKERSPHTPVVLITGNALDSLEEGRVDFVMQKPFTLVDLENTAQMFLCR